MNNHRVSFRRATRADCGVIAQLYQIASDGVADYIWSTIAAPGENILDVGRRRYERDNTLFSYQNCTVAEAAGKVVGMLVAFPMHVDPTEEQTDPVLAPYAKLEEDNSYYICGVALFPQARGQGVGSRFMQLAEQQARGNKLNKLSLIVFEQNAGAKRLYERLAYREVAREPIYAHPLIHYTGDAVLMVKDLAS